MSDLTIHRGPAKAVQMTPEQEQAAADKLAKARATRRNKAVAPQETGQDSQSSAKAAANAPEATESTLSSDTPELAPTELEADLAQLGIGEPPAEAVAEDTDETPQTTRSQYENDHARWVHQQTAELRERGKALGLHFPEGTSHKLMQRKIEEAEYEANAGTVELSGALAYQNDLPADEDFDAAKAAYDEGQRKLNELRAELAGMPGRIDEAIEASDFEQLQAHRQRASELPFAIEVATLDTLKLRLAYQQMKAARSRVAMKEARGISIEATEELKRLQARQYETLNAAEMARADHDEDVIAVGQTRRELDRLISDTKSR